MCVAFAILGLCGITATPTLAQETRGRIARQAIEPIVSDRGMVVSETSLASDIGADILVKGGSAVDAAIAVGFALAVTWPEAGNIGGGGFMMVAPPNDAEVVCVDYRETAPAAASADMFIDKPSRFWHGQVGVPGTVRGFGLAHEHWGKLTWSELIEPSIALAEHGFEVDQALELSLNEVMDKKIVRTKPALFAELIRVYGKPDGTRWRAGDTLVLPDLAATLRMLADGGPQAFYEGPLAQAIAQDMARHDGLVTAQDLANYQAKLRPAIHARFQGYDVFAPPRRPRPAASPSQ